MNGVMLVWLVVHVQVFALAPVAWNWLLLESSNLYAEASATGFQEKVRPPTPVALLAGDKPVGGVFQLLVNCQWLDESFSTAPVQLVA